MKYALISLINILLIFQSNLTFAQTWMNGYSYRKKITIDKNKVIAAPISSAGNPTDLINFPLLIIVQDPGLIHIAGSCTNKITDIEGRDISFSLTTAPANAINFQLDSYDPIIGKLICWVKVPVLSAKGTTAVPTSIYMYYGSGTLHDKYATASLNTWTADYSRVWHLNPGATPAISKNDNSTNPDHRFTATHEPNMSNYMPGKIGTAIGLNGVSESFTSSKESSNPLTLSCWIKLNSTGSEQIIAASDTTYGNSTDGYQLKVNAEGQLTMSIYRNILPAYSVISLVKFKPGNWYFVTALTTGKDAFLYVDGNVAGNRASTSMRFSSGGMIRLGSSKQYTNYFNGSIDEFRIQSIVRNSGWITTEYNNQSNPLEFYTISAEEYSPLQFARFTGLKNDSWMESANWSNGGITANNTSVIISAGKTAHIPVGTFQLFNQLILEQDAVLSLDNSVSVNCITRINKGASILLNNGVQVKFCSDVDNNGTIAIQQNTGSLLFAGHDILQQLTGTGTVKVYQLINDQATAANTLIFKEPVSVTGQVNLVKGTLNANGNLTFLSDSEINSASLLPIADLNSAAITGIIHVQKYISGDYPAPATARGWRLLGSPVYTAVNDGLKYYNIDSYKNSLFITGPGGTANGFDPSPLNGSTIYTHHQSLPGSLSQKYTAINSSNQSIALGKGIYVFSRGSRAVPDAYGHQIESAPFINPAGYTITHTGFAYTGNLTVDLDNRNTGSEGDGFNLLSNPYPGDIVWGKLLKTNLSRFVWLYDPLNNAYTVTDDETTIIPSGSGFFVKVLNGHAAGSLTFTESAKQAAPVIPILQAKVLNIQKRQGTDPSPGLSSIDSKQLTLKLSRNVFKQAYSIYFSSNGHDEINDDDAFKVGEGYVSIAGLVNGNKLAMDDRPLIREKKEIGFYIKGWGTGNYVLTINGIESFNEAVVITLRDHYLKTEKRLINEEDIYDFNIDSSIPQSQGAERFTLFFEPITNQQTDYDTSTEIKAYPNPFKDQLFLKLIKGYTKGMYFTLSNLFGQTILKQEINKNDTSSEIIFPNLAQGLYFLQIFRNDKTKAIKVFKLLKE